MYHFIKIEIEDILILVLVLLVMDEYEGIWFVF